MKIHLKSKKGITLVGLLTSILVLGVLATFLGKLLFFVIKSKNRVEAKTSVIDHETTLVSLIASRLKTVVLQNPCAFNSVTFKTAFNSPPSLLFPFPSIPLTIESDSSTDPNLKTFKDLLATSLSGVKEETASALSQCASMKIPGPDDKGVYSFCVALNNRNSEVKKSVSFLFSECAFVQIRVDLLSKTLPQNQKVFGPPLLCKEWNNAPTPERQFKLTYRIFWKARNDPKAYFSKMGMRTLNLSELRSF